MNQVTYLSQLKRALAGMPAADVADMLADCERHFIDGAAAGRDEAGIAAALGDPRRMAAELRAAAGVAAYEKKSSFRNLLRLIPVLGGLASFNLLMLVPALVLPIMLLSSYILSGSAVVAGTVITASGVTGIDQIGGADAPYRLTVSDFGVRLATPADIDIDVGQAAGIGDQASFSRWRIGYGVLYFVLGVFLWRASGRMARAMMLGLLGYLRLNRSMIKDAARPAS